MKFISRFYKSHKTEVFLFLLMLALELAMIFVLSQRNGVEIFFRGDGRDYENLANNLIRERVLAITPFPPYTPTNFRTPIYPFWLAFIFLIFSSHNAAIFIGAAIFALSAPLVYLITKEIFSEKISLVAAVLFVIEPWTLYQSGFISAEQIFMPIFLFSVYLFLLYLKYDKTRNLYLASAVLGIATLIRPVTIFFIATFVFLCFIFKFKNSLGRAFKISIFTSLIFFAVLSPWFIRNKFILNSWQFSSASGIRIFGDYIMLEQYLGKTKPGEVVDIYEKARQLLNIKSDWGTMTVENSKKMSQVALEEIKLNFGPFLKMYSKNIPLFFFKNSYGNIFFDFGVSDSNIQSKIVNNLKQKKDFSAVSLIRDLSFGAKILLFLVILWPIITFLAIFGVFKMFKERLKDPRFWLLILWILYFSILTATARDLSRYRLAIHAPLFMLVIYGFYEVKKYILIYANKT